MKSWSKYEEEAGCKYEIKSWKYEGKKAVCKYEINKPIKDGGSTAGLPPCNKPKDQQSN